MEFVSLMEVIQAVSHDIPIPESWVDVRPQLEERPSLSNTMRISMFNSFAKKVYRDSEAAATLDQHLHNATTKERPRWFDLQQTGKPKLNDTAHGVALEMLVHMANWIDRFENAYSEGKISWWSMTGIKHDEGSFKTDRDSYRIREIGFDKVALYKNPKLLVLDEATSHLDVWNEQAVNSAIKQIPLTRIIVAHRPETIAMAERVVVLQQGSLMRDMMQ